jgi:WhiB family redox-sensing transcriptional regulator
MASPGTTIWYGGQSGWAVMTAIHDALRRDLDELLDTTASQARAQARWAVFRDQLDFHLAAEQAVMWLPARAWLASDPRARALLDAMDDERGLIGPLRAVTDEFTMGADPGRLRQLLVRLRTRLASHLAHEEAEALPLISDAVSPGELSRITRALRGGYRARSAARTIPWALDRASPVSAPRCWGSCPYLPGCFYRAVWLPGYTRHAPPRAAGPATRGERPHMPMTAAPAVPADWTTRGACRDAGPDLFFPIGSLGPAQRQIAQAKAVCTACPVRTACLRYALDSGQRAGIWAGTTEDERREIRSARTARRAFPPSGDASLRAHGHTPGRYNHAIAGGDHA